MQIEYCADWTTWKW